jgi:outer membrane immunogenic protein
MFRIEKKMLNKKNLCLASIITFSFICEVEASNSSSFWDGQYVGFTIGSSYSNGDPTVQVIKNGYFVTTDPSQVNPAASHDLKSTNVNGSFFWGSNRRSKNILYGVEAAVSLADFNEEYKSGDITYLSNGDSFAANTNIKSNVSVGIRARLGYINKKSLFYTTLGPSIRKFKYDFNFTDTTQPQLINVNESKWKLGWAGSIGYERQMEDNWSVRAEFEYTAYKNIVDSRSTTVGNPNDGLTHSLDFIEKNFKIGLSKRF